MIRGKVKRSLSSILCSIAVLLSTIPIGVGASETHFSDMPQDWSTKALEAAVENGLLKGYDGKIMAKETLTRAEMATIINRAFGAVKTVAVIDYSDLKQSDWFYPEFQKALGMKTFEGSEGRMNPNQGITREQALLVLSRALRLETKNESILSSFPDAKAVSSWAKSGVASMVEAGYIHGSDGKLNPQQTMTRAEFAQMMNNIIQTYIKEPGTIFTLPEGSVMISVPNVTLENVTVKGNLILGDGIGEGNVTLNNVKVEGDTIIRGGGINSVIIKGNSKLGKVVISKVDGHVRVSVEGNAEVEVIIVEDGKDDVKLEGSFETIAIDAEIPVILENATVQTLEIAESAQSAKVTVGSGTVVTTANVRATGVTLSGEGKVTTTNVKASDVKIGIVGTTANVDGGVTGVTSNGYTLQPGSTSKTTEDKPTLQQSTSGGGSTGGGSNPTTYVYSAKASVTVNSKEVSYQSNNNTASKNTYNDVLKGVLTNTTAQSLLEKVAQNLTPTEFSQLDAKTLSRKTQLLTYINNSSDVQTAGLHSYVSGLSLGNYLSLSGTGTVNVVGGASSNLISNMDSFYSTIQTMQPQSGSTEETVVNFLTGFFEEAIKTGVTIKVNGTNISTGQITEMVRLLRSNPTISAWYDSGYNTISVSGLTFLSSHNATVTLSLTRSAQ